MRSVELSDIFTQLLLSLDTIKFALSLYKVDVPPK
jgi:hypothetical protein